MVSPALHFFAARSPMIEITELHVYPVKSCRGISVNSVQLSERGLAHDREFLVVDENDSFLTQRNAPELATIETALTATELCLRGPESGELHVPLRLDGLNLGPKQQRTVTIFSDTVIADDAGDEAADWWSGALKRKARLVRVGASYARGVPMEEIASEHRAAAAAKQISFTDAFPILLTTEESLADLNRRLPEAIPMDRFRPSIVVRGPAAYDENRWSMLRCGATTFRCAQPCLRCVISTTDQESGLRTGPEPLRTLSQYRRAPDGSGVMFGQYLMHEGDGGLRVGDNLTAE